MDSLIDDTDEHHKYVNGVVDQAESTIVKLCGMCKQIIADWRRLHAENQVLKDEIERLREK